MTSTQKVLVTGGAGFIGSHVVDALLEQGAEVTVLDIKTKKEAVNLQAVIDKINYIEGDIRDQELLASTTKGNSHVLHLAAVVSVPESIANPIYTHDVNVTGTVNVFETARMSGVKRVVYASSAAVYGDVDEVPTSENALKKPLSPYGLQKYIDEQYAQLYFEQYTLETVGLRFFNVFGSRQDPSSPYSGVISIFVKNLKADNPINVYGDGSATRDFVHVSDVVQACLLALFSTAGKGEVFNVGTSKRTSINDLIHTLEKVLEVEAQVEYCPEREGDILHSCSSIKKISKELSYQVKCSLETGVRECLQS